MCFFCGKKIIAQGVYLVKYLKAFICNGFEHLIASKLSLNYQDKVDNAKIRVSSSNRHHLSFNIEAIVFTVD